MTAQESEDEVFYDADNGETKEEDEGLDILEIIEELSYDDEMTEEFDKSTSSGEPAEGSRPSAHEFSLSSIGFALAGTLSASTHSLGSATASLHSKGVEKLKQSLSQIQTPNNRDLGPNNSSHHSSSTRRSSLFKKQPRQPRASVDFGPFESRAERLRYTQEDIFDIADDPAQMNDLRQALRSVGAITNTMLKEKLHWYVKNSKRARREELERLRHLRQLEEERRRQGEQKEAESEVEPITPPTEYKVMDGEKVLQSAGVINSEDPSPKSVRGIFVPPS